MEAILLDLRDVVKAHLITYRLTDTKLPCAIDLWFRKVLVCYRHIWSTKKRRLDVIKPMWDCLRGKSWGDLRWIPEDERILD